MVGLVVTVLCAATICTSFLDFSSDSKMQAQNLDNRILSLHFCRIILVELKMLSYYMKLANKSRIVPQDFRPNFVYFPPV